MVGTWHIVKPTLFKTYKYYGLNPIFFVRCVFQLLLFFGSHFDIPSSFFWNRISVTKKPIEFDHCQGTSAASDPHPCGPSAEGRQEERPSPWPFGFFRLFQYLFLSKLKLVKRDSFGIWLNERTVKEWSLPTKKPKKNGQALRLSCGGKWLGGQQAEDPKQGPQKDQSSRDQRLQKGWLWCHNLMQLLWNFMKKKEKKQMFYVNDGKCEAAIHKKESSPLAWISSW